MRIFFMRDFSLGFLYLEAGASSGFSYLLEHARRRHSRETKQNYYGFVMLEMLACMIAAGCLVRNMEQCIRQWHV